jgi:hypothetical protein
MQGIPDQTQLTQAIPDQGIQATQQDPTAAYNSGISDDWKQYDLRQNPYLIGWGEFNVDPSVSDPNWWKSNLSQAYQDKKKPPQNQYPWVQNAIMGMNGGNQNNISSWANNGALDAFGNPKAPQNSGTNILGHWMNMGGARDTKANAAALNSGYNSTTNRINFKDAKLDAAIDALNAKAMGVLTPKVVESNPYQHIGFGALGSIGNLYNGRNKKAEPSPIVAGDTYGWAPVSRIADNAARDKMYAEVAAQQGMTVQDLQALYGKYDRANRAIHEPVGASWQDLKASPFYDKGLLSGIRQYSGYGDNFFKNLNAKAGGADNPYYLPAEYFALHDPKQVRAGYGGDGSIFNSQYEQKNKGFSDIAHHDPYAHQDWTDYITSGKEWWQLSPAEVAKAKADMAHHTDLLDNTPEKGGPFDLAKISGVTPGKLKGRKPNYWKDSATLNMSDISDNMMLHSKGALNDYTDAQRNAAIQSAIQIGKKKKKGKGGFLGGIGKMLGPLSAIASFVPGLNAIALPLKIASAVSSFANGNPLGGLASIVGASGLGNTLASSIGSSINGAVSTTSALSGMGDTIGSALVGGGLGALGGAASGNAGFGALTGGLSPFISSGLTGAGMDPKLASMTTSGINMGAGYLNNQAKMKQAQKSALAKMKAQRRV